MNQKRPPRWSSLLSFLLALACLSLAGCTYYQVGPYIVSKPEGITGFDRLVYGEGSEQFWQTNPKKGIVETFLREEFSLGLAETEAIARSRDLGAPCWPAEQTSAYDCEYRQYSVISRVRLVSVMTGSVRPVSKYRGYVRIQYRLLFQSGNLALIDRTRVTAEYEDIEEEQ